MASSFYVTPHWPTSDYRITDFIYRATYDYEELQVVLHPKSATVMEFYPVIR
jgi:hypothetical protein